MEGIGELFGGLARGAMAGMQLDQNQQRIGLAGRQSVLDERRLGFAERQAALTGELTQAQIGKVRAELGDAAAFGEAMRKVHAEQENVVSGHRKLTQFGQKY